MSPAQEMKVMKAGNMIAARAIDDIDLQINYLLELWHRYTSGYQLARGLPGRDATCRDHRSPGHFDSRNGAEEARAEALLVKGISDAIDTIPNTPRRWHTALAFEARNLASRAAVWSSPVLPKDREELAVLILEARTMLLARLRRDGLLT